MGIIETIKSVFGKIVGFIKSIPSRFRGIGDGFTKVTTDTGSFIQQMFSGIDSITQRLFKMQMFRGVQSMPTQALGIVAIVAIIAILIVLVIFGGPIFSILRSAARLVSSAVSGILNAISHAVDAIF